MKARNNLKTKLAPFALAQLTALAALASACGNVTVPTLGENKATAEEESKKEGANPGATTKEGVRLALALPEAFDDGTSEEDLKAEDSSIADELEAALADQGIKVTCDDGQVLSWELAKNQGLRGIFELTVVNYAADQGYWKDDFDETKPDDGDLMSEVQPDKYDFEKDSGDERGLKCREGDESDEGDGRDGRDEKDEWSSDAEADDDYASEPDYGYGYDYGDGGGLGGMSITHLAIPFVCSGNATIQLLSLETSGKYVIEGALYTAEGNLSYRGSSDAFTPADTSAVELAMQKVEESNGDVDVHVVFQDEPTKGTEVPSAVDVEASTDAGVAKD